MDHFFAFLNRMKYIERWSLMRSVKRENIMEHSEEVAVLAHALAVIGNTYFGKSLNPEKAALYAVFHESSEVITGDLPTPIKYFNAEIKTAYKDLEHYATDKLLAMLPEEMAPTYRRLLQPDTSCYEYVLMKAADKLSAYLKCVEELKAGNNEFKKAYSSIERELKQQGLDEVKFFLKRFAASYELSLDELE